MPLITMIVSVTLVAALIFWRFHREPCWVAGLRLILAFVITWNALATWESYTRWRHMRERAAAGDLHAHDYDTGGGAAMILIGWIPASAFVILQAGVRRTVIRFSQQSIPLANMKPNDLLKHNR